MLVAAMKPTAAQIQTQNIRGAAPSLLSTSCTANPDQMLVASPSPLSPSKRPKLSLQTSSVPVAVGKSTTALAVSMSALQSASPTVRNTFNNAYDIPLRPSPIGISPSTKWPRSVPSTISKREEQPYEIPHNIKGILRNPPYVSSLRRSTLAATNSASPRSGRRVFFPPIKKVMYRTPLEEEIKTVKFIARHSDISSEEDSEEENRKTAGQEGEEASLSPFGSHAKTDRVSRPITSPVLGHGKRKRKPREWRWTLSSLGDEEAEVISPLQKAPRPALFVNTKSDVSTLDKEEQRARKTPFPFDNDRTAR